MAARFKSSDLTSALLPIMVTERGLLAMLVVTQLFATLLAFSPMSVGSVWERLGLISLFIHLVNLVSLAIIYLLRRYLEKLSDLSEIVAIIAVFQFLTATVSIAYHIWLFNSVDWYAVVHHCVLGLCAQLLFLYLMSIYSDKIATVKALSKAELNALHARIRPHFFNNSLNTIAELTQIDALAAEQATLNLARLSQAAMKSDQMTTLASELQLTKQYLELERWRFGERFEVNWHIRSMKTEIKVPVLSVKPLLENAINYGVEPCVGFIAIDVTVYDYKHGVKIKICNPIRQDGETGKSGQGMALSNIRARLDLHFGSRSSLNTYINNDVFTAELSLPSRG